MPVNSSANNTARSSSKKPASTRTAAPTKAAPKKASTRTAATTKAAPKKAAPKKAAPKKAAPKQAAPKKAAPKKAATKKAATKQAATKKVTAGLTAPHLAEPTLKYVTARSYRAYHSAVSRGFQEPDRDEVAEFDKQVFEYDRSFGFAVGNRWVSTCAAFTRSISVPGGAEVPAAAVTVVTVHPPFRRKGLLRKMMQHQLEDVARRGEPLATLWASESLIYGRFGYGPAVSAARLSGKTRRLQFLPGVTVSGSVDEVTREQFLAVAPGLHAAARTERPGWLDRDGAWWEFSTFDLEFARDGATPYRYVLHYNDSGDVDGYAFYRFKEGFGEGEPTGEVRIAEVQADDPQAYAGLWRYLLDLDLARSFTLRNAPVDEPLRHLVADARAVRTEVSDNIYIRVVDVAAALQARRYAAEIDLVIDVTDDLLPDNTGRYRLQAGPDHAEVTRAPKSSPDLSLSILELGAVYLGGVALQELHRVGRITEHTAGAVAAASTAFGWHRRPWCPDHF